MSPITAALTGCLTKSPSSSLYDKRVAAEEFQVWTLKVDLVRHTGILTCEDGNGNKVFEKALEFTDFPLPEITLWFANNTIFLPSEY